MNVEFIKEKSQQTEGSTMAKAKTETIEPIIISRKGKPVKNERARFGLTC